MKRRKIVTLVITLMMFAASFAGCGKGQNNQSAQIPGNPYGLVEDVKDGAILHCFSWSFKTIEESLEDIAMAGYSAVQTSPINACYDGGNAGMELFGQGKWYYHYQPTDWTIGNYQLGTREEFISLCKAADEYGIKVIVDVAPNHTTTTTEAISKSFIDAVGGMDKLYHKNGRESIVDYKNREQCTLKAVGGLYDVDTENPAFQEYFIQFLNDCVACGADGFRFDTAKHIGLADDPQEDPEQPNNFWERVVKETDNYKDLFVYGEVLQDGGERIEDYIKTIGAATSSAYGERIRASFMTSVMKADLLTDLKIGDAKPNVVTWVESHDNYTGDGTAKILDNNDIRLAYAFLASRSEGTPLFFARPYGASGDNMWGDFNKIGMAGDNLYKDPTVAAANHFRNAMVNEPEHIYNPENSERVVCLERGKKGLLILNAGREAFTTELSVKLADGTYTNHCNPEEIFTVESGKIHAVLQPGSIAVLYNEGEQKFAAPARVMVAEGTRGYILGESLEVTLESENAAKAAYSVDGGAEVPFVSGDKVVLGEGKADSEMTTLTLTAENAEGNKTCMTYLFKKQGNVSAGTKIYFEKPESWGNTISAYVYDESSYTSVKENGKWPGVKMTKEADGTYSYTFEAEWIAPLVIFNDGTNQSNGALEPGEEIIADKIYSVSRVEK